MQRKIGAAYYIKGKFLEFVRRKGMEDNFLRLSGRGPDSYPTDKDFHALAEFMGGSLLLSHESGEEVGPVQFGPDGVSPLLHIFWSQRRDGAGHEAPHYDLLQTWVRPMEPPPYANRSESAGDSNPLIDNIPALAQRQAIPGAFSHDAMF